MPWNNRQFGRALLLGWTLMCPTPPPVVTGHASQPWQRAANTGCWHWLPALPSQPESPALIWGLLAGERFNSPTGTGCPASLHPPSQSCTPQGILPDISVSSWLPLHPHGHLCSLLGIPSGIPASTQAPKGTKEQITPSTKAFPSLGCYSPSKPELTSPAPSGLVTRPSWRGEAEPLGPDPVYFLCELGNVSH